MGRAAVKGWIRVAAAVAVWTIFGILSALQVYIRDVRPAGGSLWSVFGIVYFYWAWAATTPLIFLLADRVGGDGRVSWRRAGAAIPVAVAIMVVQSALYAVFGALDGEVQPGRIPRATLEAALTHFVGNLLTLGTVVVAIVSFRYYQATQRRLVVAAELEAALTGARLDLLRAQLQPHFLFNTLNIVSGLVARGDATTANTAIARLGDLLRASLESTGGHTTTVAREIELTNRYLDIARLRLGDRLVVRERIDAAALSATVPTMILQPLVENAVQHGIATRVEGGLLRVEADVVGRGKARTVRIAIHDDGPGFSTDSPSPAGVGLANTRARLAHSYGGSASLVFTGRPGETSATIEIPFPE